MSADRLYKQAIKRVSGEKYHDEHLAMYWGRDDGTIHVITSFRHYVHKISSDQEDTLEFVSGVDVSLTDDERSQLERAS